MTKKALTKILAFAVAAIAVTAILIVCVLSNYYENETYAKLKAVAGVVETEIDRTKDYSFINYNIGNETQITIYDKNGKELASNIHSRKKTAITPNEIEALKKSNEYKSKIHLKNSDKTLCNFSLVTKDSYIIYISSSTDNIAGIFKSVWPYILLSLFCALLGAVIVSLAITKSIVKPVEEMGKNLNDLDSFKTYSELTPFVNALKEQKKKQKLLDKQKKQFTANVSHELKTPLTSIAGYAELIETGIAKPEDIKPFAHIIRKQALRLVTLSEDIIQLSQLDEGDERKITFEEVDIFEICKTCVESLSINARVKGIEIELKGESCFVKGNSALLEELVYNLCDNAIRYNKENGRVSVTVKPQDGGAVLTVSDTGIGIDKKYQERVFERFFRVDKSRSKETGGTGLGLAIVKHIAQIHDADLSVESELNKGTAITITLK